MLQILSAQYIKNLAKEYGFDDCGIAKAAPLYDDAIRLEKWLQQGKHGSMTYMENNFDLRIDPTKLLPGAKSVITLTKNYYPKQKQAKGIPKVAAYAYGKDYHEVIKTQLKLMLQNMQNAYGNIIGRGFVDSAPVLERSWATKAGIGWVGKNGNLINKKKGSFFFLATLIVDIELPYDNAFTNNYCGTCTKCIDSCPTDAIEPNKTINGSKCISYFTIELKDALIPEKQKGLFDDWLFGCDICQDVCPWNKFSIVNNEPAFTPIPQILTYTAADWETLTEDAFKEIFRHSPIKRTKYAGIKRNLSFLQQ